MYNQAAMFSEATCGEACWAAREDICRCSCFGANHGILRDKDGVRPVRSRKLNGYVYELLAVEAPPSPDSCRAVTERPIENLEQAIVKKAVDAGLWSCYDFSSTPGYPVKIKTAAPGEVERWPELAAWRGRGPWGRPIVAWIRADMKELVSE